MYASAQHLPKSYAVLLRACGRLGGLMVMVSWGVMVAVELWRVGTPFAETYFQAAAIGLVFLGYIVGWWKELLGGFTTVIGTIVFFAVCTKLTYTPPMPEGVFLALPGLFYIMAHEAEQSQPQQFGQTQ